MSCRLPIQVTCWPHRYILTWCSMLVWIACHTHHTSQHQETQELQKKQQWYHQNQPSMSKEDEEAYLEYCSEAMFRIKILETRLNRCRIDVVMSSVHISSAHVATPKAWHGYRACAHSGTILSAEILLNHLQLMIIHLCLFSDTRNWPPRSIWLLKIGSARTLVCVNSCFLSSLDHNVLSSSSLKEPSVVVTDKKRSSQNTHYRMSVSLL